MSFQVCDNRFAPEARANGQIEKGDYMTTAMITPKDFARLVNGKHNLRVDDKRVRSFLRAMAEETESDTPGKGKRWGIPATESDEIMEEFVIWNSNGGKGSDVNASDIFAKIRAKRAESVESVESDK